MRQALVAGNWKMNGSLQGNETLLQGLRDEVERVFDTVEVVVFPPFVFLEQVSRLLSGTAMRWGGQDVSAHDAGAYTGDICASMLREMGCVMALVGHSERRQYHGESNALTAEKCQAALLQGLVPVLCLGETIEQRQAGETENVVLEQLEAALPALIDHDFVLAYEPVWAIGTGLTATPQQAQDVHALLRQAVAKHSAHVAETLRILYGGSVKASNAAELFAMPDIDGGLVGGASLSATEFRQIIHAAG